MQPVTESEIRASFVNASRREATQAPAPPGLDEIDWDARDFLGWVDPQAPRRAYAVVPTTEGPVGLLLRTTQTTGQRPAICTWCEDVKATEDVVLYVAKRAGSAGRNGNTVGTLVHADLACSAHARRRPTRAEGAGDPEAFVARRIAGLRERTVRFAERVRDEI
ncbi:FBP domain-containing protein [Mumia zhuanghuii]|uniref:FBP domain-containing protein n=1 Tax=Mumia zhuanghuii TaxID=2585211 RepID=A0A5C4MIL8_9ACTN|nr:FBP domain-containing protein [Mumia zhuanghuii]TNC42466.1 FBP domain-containing protein [Mumia zhuanghuii]TNC43687.1 FBP domain-containing protein [Mumia zhuanghuii]